MIFISFFLHEDVWNIIKIVEKITINFIFLQAKDDLKEQVLVSDLWDVLLLS